MRSTGKMRCAGWLGQRCVCALTSAYLARRPRHGRLTHGLTQSCLLQSAFSIPAHTVSVCWTAATGGMPTMCNVRMCSSIGTIRETSTKLSAQLMKLLASLLKMENNSRGLPPRVAAEGSLPGLSGAKQALSIARSWKWMPSRKMPHRQSLIIAIGLRRTVFAKLWLDARRLLNMFSCGSFGSFQWLRCERNGRQTFASHYWYSTIGIQW